MGTVVAIETEGGVAIAADRRATRDGTVTGESVERILDLDDVGAGAVGDEGAVGDFRRRLKAAVNEMAHDREVDIENLGRTAGRIAEDAGVEAVVAAHDDEGVARLRQVGSDGSVLSDSYTAIGSGAAVALGRLETADRDRELESTEDYVRDVVETVAERDSDTGEAVEVWSVANGSA